MGFNRSRQYGKIKERRDKGLTPATKKRIATLKRLSGRDEDRVDREGSGKTWEYGQANRAAVRTFRAYGGQITPSNDPERKDKRWFRLRADREAYPFCTCDIFCPRCDMDKEELECHCTVPCIKHRWGLA
jgi:hypothetical protein